MTTRPPTSLPYPPVLMRREEAAAYVRVSPTTFDALVDDGTMPQPARLGGRIKVWHRHHLDAAAAALFDDDAVNPFDKVGAV